MERVGFPFKPRDPFLVKILQYKAAGGGDVSRCSKGPGDLCELDLYGSGKEPWRVFSGDNEIRDVYELTDPERRVREKYVVTKLTKIGKKNVSRIAGAGSWDDQSKSKPLVYGGHKMGYWKTLTYEYCGDDGAEQGKCHYYMNELHLSEHALRLAGVSDTDYVLCRILKDLSKNCRGNCRGKKRKKISGHSAASPHVYLPPPEAESVHDPNISGPPEAESVHDPNISGPPEAESVHDPNISGPPVAESVAPDYMDLLGDIPDDWLTGCSSIFPDIFPELGAPKNHESLLVEDYAMDGFVTLE